MTWSAECLHRKKRPRCVFRREHLTRALRTVLDSDDRPVEVQATIAAADRHEFRYEVAMDRK
jgi:DNA-binding GntR family transcriptional regulator